MSEFGKMLILLGVKFVNQNGSYRRLDDIITDIIPIWNTLSFEQRDIISQAFNEAII